MPKIKIPRKSVSLDMTAMCDVAFLLLSFFMLTTTFKPEEPIQVDAPTSVSELKMPEKDNVVISIGRKGEVFFGIDGESARVRILERVAASKNVSFTAAQKKAYSQLAAHGVPVQQLPSFLDLPSEKRSGVVKKGIPVDTADTKNEFRHWIKAAIDEKRKLNYVIKGDGSADFKTVKWVIATMQELKVNRFVLVTSLERAPTTAPSNQ